MGTDKKNENLAAVSRSRTKKSPIVIVIPEGDVPGINANICENPISSASLLPMVFIARCCFPTLSDNHSSKPKKIVVNEIIKGLRK